MAVPSAANLSINKIFGSDEWLRRFMARKRLALRRVTNLTKQSNEELVDRACSYFAFVHASILNKHDPKNIILMNETGVYFENTRQQTVERTGARHVNMLTTGFSSTRITSVMAERGDGTKVKPLAIFKGKNDYTPRSCSGCIWMKQKHAWVDSGLLIE